MNILRKILHYQDSSSDKVYIIDINKIGQEYIVTATWGKRSAPRLSSQIKGEFHSEWQASNLAKKLIDDKKRGKSPYKDAAHNLTIDGLPKLNKVGLGQVHVSNKSTTPSSITIELHEDLKVKRNIKL